MQTTRLLTLPLLFLAGLSGVARADERFAADRDAVALEELTDNLFREIRSNFVQAPNYGALVGSSARLRGEAIALHRLLHSGSHGRDLQRRVDSLDVQAHRLADEIFDASRGARYDRHARPCDTRRAQQLVRSIENTIHCLEDHLADFHGHDHGGQVPYNQPAFGTGPLPRGAQVNVGGRGFSFQLGR